MAVSLRGVFCVACLFARSISLATRSSALGEAEADILQTTKNELRKRNAAVGGQCVAARLSGRLAKRLYSPAAVRDAPAKVK